MLTLIKDGHFQIKWLCPTLTEPCACKPIGYAIAMALALATAALEFWGSGTAGSVSPIAVDSWCALWVSISVAIHSWAALSVSLALGIDAVHVSSDFVVYAVAMAGGIIAMSNPARAVALKQAWAVGNANVITAVAFAMIAGAFYRAFQPVAIETDVMLAVAGAGLAANGVMYLVLNKFKVEREHKHGSHDHLHDTTILHTLGDTLSSVVVVAVGKALEMWPWLYGLDPIGSVLIAVFLMKRADETKRKIRMERGQGHKKER